MTKQTQTLSKLEETIQTQLTELYVQTPQSTHPGFAALEYIRKHKPTLLKQLVKLSRTKYNTQSAQAVLDELGHTKPTPTQRLDFFLTYQPTHRDIGQTTAKWIASADIKLARAIEQLGKEQYGTESLEKILPQLGIPNVNLQLDLERIVSEKPEVLDTKGRVIVSELRKNGPLFHQLSEYAKAEFGFASPSLALSNFGLKPPLRVTEQDIIQSLFQIIPPKTAIDILEHNHVGEINVKRMLRELPDGEEIYAACFNKKREDTNRLLAKYPDSNPIDARIDEMYADLRNIYGKRSVARLLQFKDLQADDLQILARRFAFSGVNLNKIDLSAQGPVQTRFVQRVLGWQGDDLLETNYKAVFAKLAAIPSSQKRVLGPNHYFAERYSEKKGDAEKIDAAGESSRIVESEFALLMKTITNYDPSMEMYFDSELQKVIRGEVLHFQSQLFEYEPLLLESGEIADGRIEVQSPTTGETKRIVVEIKNMTGSDKHSRISEIHTKYEGKTWDSGETIDQKLAYINSPSQNITENTKYITDNGWDVILPEQFSHAYAQCLDALIEEQPRFFTHGPIPVSKQQLLELRELLEKKPHLLSRQGNRQYRRWAKQMFADNITALQNLDFTTLRKPLDIPAKIKKPLTHWENIYGTDVHNSIPNTLFYDLETAGTTHEGAPIYVLGMGYIQNGVMQVEVLNARHFHEEKRLLQRFSEVANQFTYRATYNGEVFDEPYLHARGIANGIAIPDQPHIDIYPQAKRKRMQFGTKSKHSLTSLEKQLYDFRRKDDIAGEKIPQVWKDLMYKGNTSESYASLYPNVITHNQLDVATTIMVAMKYGEFPDGTLMLRK